MGIVNSDKEAEQILLFSSIILVLTNGLQGVILKLRLQSVIINKEEQK
jgi:hypothetical protein